MTRKSKHKRVGVCYPVFELKGMIMCSYSTVSCPSTDLVNTFAYKIQVNVLFDIMFVLRFAVADSLISE